MRCTLNMIKNTMLCASLFVTQAAFSADNFTTCPSGAELKKAFSWDEKTFDADLTYTVPMGFDLKANTIKMSVFKKNWVESGSFNFILSNLTVPAGEDAEEIGFDLIETLQADNPTPISFRVEQAFEIPLCTYSSTEDSEVKAVVFYAPDTSE
ncbi:MAG: hypothetical protein P1U36_01215 [Legionellaceae bacterium]|nr:hypothetical protein [Legionellaceae bacterium]